MERRIKIFKPFEEHEMYQLQKSKQTTVAQRLHNLFYMQNLSKKFHPEKGIKTILISHEFTTS